VDAGLGELGRNGLLVTPEFGSRVRLCKVFTELPLQPLGEAGVLTEEAACDVEAAAGELQDLVEGNEGGRGLLHHAGRNQRGF